MERERKAKEEAEQESFDIGSVHFREAHDSDDSETLDLIDKHQKEMEGGYNNGIKEP